MAQIAVKLSIRVAWWLRWYLAGVALVARMTGATPDWRKIESRITRGMSVNAIRRP